MHGRRLIVIASALLLLSAGAIFAWLLSAPRPAFSEKDAAALGATGGFGAWASDFCSGRLRVVPRLADMKLFDNSYCDGAAKRTRTSTPVKELAPQASASTSSAMAAHSRKPTLAKARRLTNRPGDDKGDGGRALRASGPRTPKSN